MKKIAIIKKKEVLIGILAIFLMLIGFISYKPNMENEYGKIADVNNYSEHLGEATLVSSNSVVNNENIENISENMTENTIETNKNVTENDTQNKTENIAKETSTEEEKKSDNSNYFLKEKMDRNNIYSETIEIYEKMLENSNITNEQKAIAQTEISNITNEKKTIQTAENLIKMKGFDDVVIFKNASGISVIVKSDVLLPEQVAQIQNILEREFQIESKNINITNK